MHCPFHKRANRPGGEPGEPARGVWTKGAPPVLGPVGRPPRPPASLSVPSCRCPPRRAPDPPRTAPLPRLRSGRTLQSCVGNGWVEWSGPWAGVRLPAAPCPACPAHSRAFLPPTATAQLTRSCGPSQPWRCRSDGMSSPSCSSCSPGRCWSPCGTRAPSRPCSPRARVSPALPGFADGETAACRPESPDAVTPAWRPESPLLSQRGTGDDLADDRSLGG